MPRPKKSLEERIEQTQNEIKNVEIKLETLRESLQELLKEKEEQEKQSYYDLIKEQGLSYDEVVKLLSKNKM